MQLPHDGWLKTDSCTSFSRTSQLRLNTTLYDFTVSFGTKPEKEVSVFADFDFEQGVVYLMLFVSSYI